MQKFSEIDKSTRQCFKNEGEELINNLQILKEIKRRIL